MRNLKSFKLFLPVVLMAFLFAGCSDDDDDGTNGPVEQDQAAVRVIHASYDAPDVDISVDDVVAITDLAYMATSGYAMLDAGTRNVKVTPAGETTPVVINADLTLEKDKSYTVIAVDQLASIDAVIAEDMRTPNASKAKVRFLHASPDAPAVDIKLNSGSGPAVFSGQAFKSITDYAEVDQATYTFVVTAAGDTNEVFVLEPVTLYNNTVYTVMAYGTLDPSDSYPFRIRAFIDNGDGNTFANLNIGMSEVMVVHASPDAPGVDLLVDNIVVNAAALNFPDNTGYLNVTAGTRNIKVNASGTSTTVIEANLNLDWGADYSVFAIDSLNSIEPLVLVDDLTPPAAGQAHVRFIHLSPDAPAVDITLTDGTVIFGDYEFKEYTAFTPLDSGTYNLQVRAAGTSTVVLDLPGITLTDGMIYTVFARGFLGGSGDQALGAEIIVNY